MKISKRVQILAAIVGSGIVVASSACGVDSIVPTATRNLAPMSAAEADKLNLVGVADGTYNFTIDPTIDNVVHLGPNRLELPARAVCALGVSGYGPTLWDNGCNPQRRKFTLTVVIANAASDSASMDFEPAMRFDPNKRVALYFYTPTLTPTNAPTWTIFYCPTGTGHGHRSGSYLYRGGSACVDESLLDPSVATQADYTNHFLFRRVKHFTGYTVSD